MKTIDMRVLSNEWVIWLWNTYSMAILAVPSVVTFGAKLLAIFHPDIPSDKITDLVKQYWPGSPPKPR